MPCACTPAACLLLLLVGCTALREPAFQDAQAPILPQWASPRGRNPRHKASWMKLHDKLVEEVKAWDDCTGANLLFLGDNEAWRGTFMGMSWSAFHNVPTLFDQTFGPFNATALAIAGDKVKHLMWRVLNGELPQKHPPKIIVVHVGSNDIAGTVCRVKGPPASEDLAPQVHALVDHLLLRYPAAHVILLGVLPKGSNWPNSCTPAQQRLNAGLQEYAEETERVHWVDVGPAFLVRDDKGKQEINPMLLPDTLHPSLKGMQVIAQALQPLVLQLFLDAGGTLPGPPQAPPAPEEVEEVYAEDQ